MTTSEKRARKALHLHRVGVFHREYDALFEMGDGGKVARLFYELAEAEGHPINEEHAPRRPDQEQANLFDLPKAELQETIF